MAMSAQLMAEAAMIPPRNGREGASQTHRASPATIAASTIRSRTASSVAPRGVAIPSRRAVSPSTPSRTEAAWTRSPPIKPRSADSDHAATIPTAKNASDSTLG